MQEFALLTICNLTDQDAFITTQITGMKMYECKTVQLYKGINCQL
jgi:hypothetical protein